MHSIIFAKTKLIFDVCGYISAKRTSLLEDLVAYTEDPVRFNRRLRLLKQLAQYEFSVIQKIENFDTSSIDDAYSASVLQEFQQEIDIVASVNT